MSAMTSSDAVSNTEREGLPLPVCTRTAQRFRGDSFVGKAVKVAAIRIGANGWEADIIQGLQVGHIHG